jgi:hypothetical protein
VKKTMDPMEIDKKAWNTLNVPTLLIKISEKSFTNIPMNFWSFG